MARVGILGLQGSFTAHASAFAKLGAETILVRMPQDLERVTHLVIPGGESTTMHHLMEFSGLTAALRQAHEAGAALWGTCAGAILLGREQQERPPRLCLIDIDARRNAYGRQVDSFTRDLAIPVLGAAPFHGVFIRAPKLENPGRQVAVLAQDGDDVVLARQGRVLVSTFHPELTEDLRIHELFVGMT